MSYVLALDQGTTSCRAILFNGQGELVSIAQEEFPQIYPEPGWVEHDAGVIWTTQLQVTNQLIEKAGIKAGDIKSIGITNQRETVVVWDRKTGEPISNAIVWQDRRTAPMIDKIKSDGKDGMIQQKTGLVPDAYFSATKVNWILENVPNARQRAESGELAFGTIDSWLVFKLTGGEKHITDVTNASRTMLYNINTHEWDQELLELFQVPASMMPEVRSSSEVYGHCSSDLLSAEIPIAGIAGDQQAALFGQICLEKGAVKTTYGTGCFMLMNIGDTSIESKNKLLTTVAWKTNEYSHYALEGSVFIGGAVIQWLRDELKLISSSPEVEGLASTVSDNGGVYMVPAFAGLGAPHWDSYARGSIFGITRGTNQGHFARAALESIAYQVADVLEAMKNDSGLSIPEMRVDGGATANNMLMQFQADISQVPIVRPTVTETTALGAAYLAGLATGVWNSSDELRLNWKADQRFEPNMKINQVNEYRERWSEAVSRSKEWAN